MNKMALAFICLEAVAEMSFGQVPTDSLLAYYPFSGNVIDASGRGHDGTNFGATLTSDRFGNLNSSYYFNSGTYISVPNDTVFNVTGDMTISVWYKTNGGSNFMTLLGKRDDAFGVPTSFWDLTIEVPSQRILFALFNNFSSLDYHYSQRTIDTAVWQHVVVVIKNDTSYIYLDGMLDSATPITIPRPLNSKPILIGWDRDTNTLEAFVGSIDDIRIYHRALSSSEVAALYHEGGWAMTAPTQGLLAFYPFNGDANDASGNGNNGTVNGPALTTDRFGNANGAYYFNAGNYISVPDNSSFNVSADITISAWYKTNGGSNYLTILGKRDDAFGVPTSFWDLTIEVPTQRILFALFNSFSSLDYQYSQRTIAPGVWQHVAAVIKNGTSYLYIDDVLDSSSPITISRPVNTKPLLIGWDRDTNTLEGFVGSIDDIRIYDRALRVAEVDALYHEDGWQNPLPIELTEFRVKQMNNRFVALEWATASEVNNYGFYVQRRQTSGDNYVNLPRAFIAGHGTTAIPQRYTWIDSAAAAGTWWYRLKQVDLDGASHYSDPSEVRLLVSGFEDIPQDFQLAQNFPNPFNPTTTIRYGLPQQSIVLLSVYNTLGQRVKTLVQESEEAGYHEVKFDGRNLASGVYFYRLQAGSAVQTRQLLLLR